MTWADGDQEDVPERPLRLMSGGKIIARAAIIMVLVFGSFLLSGDRILQEFGFGLAFAVLIDALIIRSLLVPAVMHRIGPANWAMPAWLDRIVPNLSLESGDETDRTPSAQAPPPNTPTDDDPADTPGPEILVGVTSPTSHDE